MLQGALLPLPGGLALQTVFPLHHSEGRWPGRLLHRCCAAPARLHGHACPAQSNHAEYWHEEGKEAFAKVAPLIAQANGSVSLDDLLHLMALVRPCCSARCSARMCMLDGWGGFAVGVQQGPGACLPGPVAVAQATVSSRAS